jgi:hypothetical protein
MKTRLWLALIAACALFLAGCEPQVSLFPLFTPQDKLFDDRLLGEWQIWSGAELKPGDTPGTIIFSTSQEAYTYDVKIPNFDGQKKITLITAARLVKLGNSLFIDFGTPNMDNLPLIPYPAAEGHVFGRLTLEGNGAHINLLSDDWTRNAVKTGKMPLAFHNVSEIILSAETSELRKFAIDYAENDAAFSQIYTLARRNPSH